MVVTFLILKLKFVAISDRTETLPGQEEKFGKSE
jgi:hypothetical protein